MISDLLVTFVWLDILSGASRKVCSCSSGVDLEGHWNLKCAFNKVYLLSQFLSQNAPNLISEYIFFKNFLGHALRPPRIGILCMLVMLA